MFSHRPAAGAGVPAYEDSLRRFHAELASASVSGFIESATFAGGEGYSDWYLLENSAAMDALNAAAVSGSRALAHDSAARMATDGVGKLLSLAAGASSMDEGFEVRLGKPAGMPYAEFYARMQATVGAPGVSLWRRMMVLGPAPEFCLLTPKAVELPLDMRPEVIARRRI